MAINKLNEGVLYLSPEQVKRYQDTAAGKYTSTFTRGRAEQWEMSLKQAEREAGIKEFEYKSKLELYRDRLKTQERELADIERLRIQVMNGQVKAEDAGIILGIKVEQTNKREQNKRDEAVSAVGAVSGGGTSTTTGGGGRRAADPTSVSRSNDTELGMAKAEAPPSTPSAFAGAVRSRLDDGRLSGGTAAESDAVKYNAVNEMVEVELARQLASDPTKSYDDARADAISIVEPLLGAANRDFFDAYARVEGAVDSAVSTSAAPRVTTTTRETEFYKKYRGLSPQAQKAAVKDVPPAPVAPRDAVLAAITAREAEIKGRNIVSPTFGSTDTITRAREIASGRFGPTTPTTAYGARNALDFLNRLSPDQFEQLRQTPSVRGVFNPPVTPLTPTPRTTDVKPDGSVDLLPTAPPPTTGVIPTEKTPVTRTRPPPEEPTPDFVMPTEEPFPMEQGQSAETLMAEAVDVGASARNPAVPPAGRSALERLASTKFAEAERRMAVESRIGAETAEAERPFQMPFEQRGGETVPFTRQPGGRADTRAMEQTYFDIQDERQRRVLPLAPEARPPAQSSPPPPPLNRISPDQAEASRQRVEAKRPDTEVDVSDVGMKAALPRPGLDTAPSRLELSNEASLRSSSILKGKTPARGDPMSRGQYVFDRLSSAQKLAGQPDKIKRLSSSGPGRVAAELYRANASSGAAFDKGWSEIAMLYSAKPDDMKLAHEVLLALDIADDKKIK